MNQHILRLALATSTAIAAAVLVACGGGGGAYGGSVSTSGNGTLSVSMTDAPSCGFDAVNVTVNKVRVNASSSAGDTDGGWTDITLNPARKINLLNLTNGVLDNLGQTALAAGHYTQLRLVLDGNTGSGLANSVMPAGSSKEVSLDTPSAVTSGIKLNGEFDVAAGQKVDLVLDFDACKSVITKGNNKYALKPVIKVIPTAVNGISGVVGPLQLTAGATVSAQQNGNIISSTTPNAATGEFFLARLAPGNYDVVITSPGRMVMVVGSVPVASTTSTTSLSTSAAPIALQPATMSSIAGAVTLTPPSTTEAATVTAKQSFAAGPTVTVRYKGAELGSGIYAIENLPREAPLYAAYSATLPLVFATASTVSPGPGMYKIEASASGYTTMAQASVDVSLVNVVGMNFALVP